MIHHSIHSCRVSKSQHAQTILDPSPSTYYTIPSSSTSNIMTIPYALLALQNAETSNAVLHAYSGKEDFIELSKFEGALTASRDQEDDYKLQAGIDIACEKGIIDPIPVPAPYTQIDVLGKTPEQVADIILETVQQDSSAGVDSSSDGCLIVLVGLSGTGE